MTGARGPRPRSGLRPRGPRFVHVDDRDGRAVVMLPGASALHLNAAMVREVVRAYDRYRYRRWLARRREWR